MMQCYAELYARNDYLDSKCYSLMTENNTILDQNKKLEKENRRLMNEIDILSEEITKLNKENDRLIKELEAFTAIIDFNKKDINTQIRETLQQLGFEVDSSSLDGYKND